MGVHGLWRLIEPSGKPVPLETLENKVLGVDISIWLHQAVKGFQDSKGAPIPNAHLLGIYHRLCKLLYFRIKPIFVFDGGVPALKRQTIAKRTQSKLRTVAAADRIQRQLLSTLLKHTAVSKVLTEKIEASIGIGTVSKVPTKQKKDDLYMLPVTHELDSTLSSSEDESQSESTTADSSPSKNWDLHTIDMNSVHFKSLPIDVRHEILTDLKETRKQSSWGRLHELPKISDDFSVYQLNRLRKRQAVQAALEDAEKEMGGKSLSLAELESILKDQGVINEQNVGTRIASDETTKYLLVKDVKKAMEEARRNDLESENKMTVDEKISLVSKEEGQLVQTKADDEYEDDLRKAIALSLECEPSTSETPNEPSTSESFEKPPTSKITTVIKTNPAEFSFLDNFTDADFASSSSDEEPLAMKVAESKMASVKSYMVEYSGLTPSEIAKIMNKKTSVSDSKKIKSKKQFLPLKHENTNKISELKIGGDKIVDTIKEPDKYEPKAHDHNIEIMSSADSSDSEIDDKDTKKVIDIIINPNQQIEDDDLFSDIFDDSSKPIHSTVVKNNKDFQTSRSVSQKVLDIVNSNQQTNKEDNLFGEICSKKEENITSHLDLGQASKLENRSDIKKSLEIIVLPSENFDTDDDLFGDVFVKSKEDSEIDTEKNSEINTHTAAERQNVKVNENRSQTVQNVNQDMADQGDILKNQQISDLIDNGQVTQTETLSQSPKNDDIKLLKKTHKEGMSEQELLKLKHDLQREKIDLLNEKSSKERIAGNITDQMYQEAQELLELFGVPYIIAPMEAEAQCAFLDAIELTDGTITDDSDIWLFGGRTVYKNFFNQSKYVMEFRADSIKHHFKLTREQMILLALLVGSDYTTGLQGVGPVTAVEILAAFPPSTRKINEFSLSHMELLSGLKEFRSWFSKGKSPGPGRNALKSKLKNLAFTENFPSLQVVEAYLEPTVETSREAFSWGKPNRLALIEFAREKFGWTRNKSEEILNPVIKRLEESSYQKSIKDYFKTRFKVHSGEAETKMSKRVKSAITNMGRDPSEIIAEELEQELKKEPKKKRATRRKKDGLEAPEFSKKEGSSQNKIVHTEKNSSRDKDDGSDKDFTQSTKDRIRRKTDKTNLGKLKSKPNIEDNQLPSSSKTENIAVNAVESKCDEVDISEKINQIRKRRQLKEAKAAIDVKKPKLPKEKTKKVTSQFEEDIPESLQTDEEINLLSQIAIHSSLKVDEINKNMQKQFESLTGKIVEVPKISRPHPTQSVSQPSPSVRRPVSRPTRVPRKEVIPQKEKDKTAVLRNKLKAIEVFRKGKRGPGYVPKKDRKKRAPKAEAGLSESSDD